MQELTYNSQHRLSEDSAALTAERKRAAQLALTAKIEAMLTAREAEKATLAKVKISTWESITRDVSAKHGFVFDDLSQRKRWPRLVRCRQEICFRLMDELGWPVKDIAKRLKIERSAVIYGIRSYAAHYAITVPVRLAGQDRRRAVRTKEGKQQIIDNTLRVSVA